MTVKPETRIFAWGNVIASLLISLNSMLLFLVIFERGIELPSLLQVAGRLHPLVLHFPLVFVLVFSGLLLFQPASAGSHPHWRFAMEILLVASAVTSAVAAIMGLFLSVQGEYDDTAIGFHKWGGLAISLILCLLYLIRNHIFLHRVAGKIGSVFILSLLAVTGHYGAVLTHGENFVFAPLESGEENALPPIEEALVYDHLVYPIFEDKCISCHNNNKKKGGLVMETRELLLKGGKTGKLWDTAGVGLGLMMERIHLPAGAKKHMPPKGKPQLSEQEALILERWVATGASFDQKIGALPPSDTLYIIAKKIFESSTSPVYDFEPADERQITRLNGDNMLIAPVAQGSPALRVTFFNGNTFSGEVLQSLDPVKDNIVEINLSHMPFRDEDLKKLSGFRNLRKLNLNFTPLTGASIAGLHELPQLSSLSLSGSAVEPRNLDALVKFPAIHDVYLWDTKVGPAHIVRWKEDNRRIEYHTGYAGDSTVLQLNPPAIGSDGEIIDRVALPVRIDHAINGVDIHYSLDGKDPDSLNAQKYEGEFRLSGNTLVKTRAFKKGWYSSEISQRFFFKRTFRPDSIALYTRPSEAYRAGGARTLIDNEKSNSNYASRKWVGFQKEDLDCALFFRKPIKASNITLSIIQDIDSYIFPPQTVEIWGGSDIHRLKRLTIVTPRQPVKMENEQIQAVECNFGAVDVTVIRIIARTLPKPPAILQDLGEKGHLFVDEIFVN